MKCTNCGSENRSSIKFCETCGTSIEKIANKAKIHVQKKTEGSKCSVCGEKNRPDVQFCETCGSPLQKIKQKTKVVKTAHKKQSRKISSPLFNLFGLLKANPYKTAFIGLTAVIVLAGMIFLIQSLRFDVTKTQARKIADTTIGSRYSNLINVGPVVSHIKDDTTHYTTYTYSQDMQAKTDLGVEVEYAITVIVRVNRTTGEYDVFEMY